MSLERQQCHSQPLLVPLIKNPAPSMGYFFFCCPFIEFHKPLHKFLQAIAMFLATLKKLTIRPHF